MLKKFLISMIVAMGCFGLSATYAAVDKDLQEVISYAEKGDSNAQATLGNFYALNKESLDMKKATYWWKKAAAQGNTDSLNNLGTAYLRGEGVKQNVVYTYVLWQAAEKKDPATKEKLAKLKELLQPDELEKVKKTTLEQVLSE